MPTIRNIDTIKATLLHPATTSHFDVEVGLPSGSLGTKLRSIWGGSTVQQDRLNIMCCEAVLPGSQLATTEMTNDFTGVTERHAYRRIYDETIDLSFYVDASNYLPIRFFETWISEIVNELPKTFQSPTMAPYCKVEEKYKVVENIVKEIEKIKKEKTKIDDQEINEILTVNGIRFTFKDGSWGLIRASSNKPSLVVVIESPTSDERKLKIFKFIDNLLQKTGKIGEYDQKI